MSKTHQNRYRDTGIGIVYVLQSQDIGFSLPKCRWILISGAKIIEFENLQLEQESTTRRTSCYWLRKFHLCLCSTHEMCVCVHEMCVFAPISCVTRTTQTPICCICVLLVSTLRPKNPIFRRNYFVCVAKKYSVSSLRLGQRPILSRYRFWCVFDKHTSKF